MVHTFATETTITTDAIVIFLCVLETRLEPNFGRVLTGPSANLWSYVLHRGIVFNLSHQSADRWSESLIQQGMNWNRSFVVGQTPTLGVCVYCGLL